MYVEVRDMTKIKVGDIVSYHICGTSYGLVTEVLDGRFFKVLLFHNLYEVLFKIKEIKLLT